MIFVDTSVWIAYFGGYPPALVTELEQLLDQDQVALAAPVRIELLSGASRSDFPRLRRLLSALPLFAPSRDVWLRIEGWVEAAMRQGQRFGVADLLIASIAAEEGGEIWSLDDDFDRMARLGFIRRKNDLSIRD